MKLIFVYCSVCGAFLYYGVLRVSAQNFEEPKRYYQAMQFDTDLRGSFNTSACIRELLNCWELIPPEMMCSRWVSYESMCGLRQVNCTNARGWTSRPIPRQAFHSFDVSCPDWSIYYRDHFGWRRVGDNTGPPRNTTSQFGNTTLTPGNTILPPRNSALPSGNPTLPPEKNTLSPENPTFSHENSTLPSGKPTLLPENTTLAPGNTTLASGITTFLPGNPTLPPESPTIPPGNPTLPFESTTFPPRKSTLPSGNSLEQEDSIRRVRSAAAQAADSAAQPTRASASASR